MITPGKYNAEATWIRQAIKAQGIILMVIKGNDGSGFSVQVDARRLTRSGDSEERRF